MRDPEASWELEAWAVYLEAYGTDAGVSAAGGSGFKMSGQAVRIHGLHLRKSQLGIDQIEVAFGETFVNP